MKQAGGETLYLKVDRNVQVHDKKVTIGDLAQILCTDKQTENLVKTIKVPQATNGKPGRHTMSVMELIERIQEEVSEEIGATREEIVMAMESASEVESLHKTIYQGDGNAISLMDGIKEEKDASEELLDHMLLNSLLGTLEEKERDLLRLRYFEDLTQVQVAKQLDMTQVQVSRMEKKILGKLRERL